jgi:hypothetical protein
LIAKRKKALAEVMYPMNIKKKIMLGLFSHYALRKNLREKRVKVEHNQRNFAIQKALKKWREELQ